MIGRHRHPASACRLPAAVSPAGTRTPGQAPGLVTFLAPVPHAIPAITSSSSCGAPGSRTARCLAYGRSVDAPMSLQPSAWLLRAFSRAYVKRDIVLFYYIGSHLRRHISRLLCLEHQRHGRGRARRKYCQKSRSPRKPNYLPDTGKVLWPLTPPLYNISQSKLKRAV